MDLIVKIAWLSLAAVHAMPAAVLFVPSMTQTLYGVAADGTIGVLLIHRGALFLALLVAALFAMFDPDARKVISLLIAISVIGFLLVYARAGKPEGALRTIAIADLVALLPLALVCFDAWWK